jgi:hypothetical protein
MSKPRVRAPRSGSLGGGSEHPQVGTAPANRTAQIRTASAIVPTIPSHSLYGAVSGIPLSNVSRIATPHSTTLVLGPRLFVVGQSGDNYGPSDAFSKKARGVASRSQKRSRRLRYAAENCVHSWSGNVPSARSDAVVGAAAGKLWTTVNTSQPIDHPQPHPAMQLEIGAPGTCPPC